MCFPYFYIYISMNVQYRITQSLKFSFQKSLSLTSYISRFALKKAFYKYHKSNKNLKLNDIKIMESTQQSAIRQYFSKNQGLRQQIIKYIHDAQQNTFKSLEEGNLKVLKQRHLSINPQISQQQKISSELNSLSKSRHQLLSQLQSVYERQAKLRYQSHKEKVKKKNILRHFSRSSPEGDQQVKQILKSQKSFEENLRKKLSQLYDKIDQNDSEIGKKQKQKREIEKRSRIKKLQENRMKLQQSREQNLKHKSLSKIRLKKKSDYIYMKNQYKDFEVERERSKYETLILNEKKVKMKTDFSQIRLHSIDHEKNSAIHRQEFIEAIKKNLTHNKQSLNFPKSKFIKLVLEEDQKRVKDEQRKKEQKQQRLQKSRQFQGYVSRNFKPTSTQHSKFTISPKNSIYSPSQKQRKQKGEEYLHFSKKNTKKQGKTNNTSRDIQNSTEFLLKKSRNHLSSKHPNYLTIIKNRQQRKINDSNFYEKMMKKDFSPTKAKQVIDHIQKKQQNLAGMKNEQRTQSQYALAKQKIKLLNSMMEMKEY